MFIYIVYITPLENDLKPETVILLFVKLYSVQDTVKDSIQVTLTYLSYSSLIKED